MSDETSRAKYGLRATSYEEASSCPIPHPATDCILMAHGGGGRLSQQLLERLILPLFPAPALAARHDGALLAWQGSRLAFTTDAHVVSPLFFPGGDIGSLAVYGTINDLAMCGARARHLSVSLILEEGLPMETLERILRSMAAAAQLEGVSIVTGDTKVVERSKCDGIYITTAGIGELISPHSILPSSIQAGDSILLSGDLGRHGMAIMAFREGLEFESMLESDCASLQGPVMALLEAGLPIHCLRDLTRGGLTSALVELAETRGLDMLLDETLIPVCEEVRAACELLGLDPLSVANEGRFVCILPEAAAPRALELLRAHPVSADARAIGRVLEAPHAQLRITGLLGVERVLDMYSGEQLPRIC